MQLWQAFGGRDQMLHAPAAKVRRVRLYLSACNEYEHEMEAERKREAEEAQRKANQR